MNLTRSPVVLEEPAGGPLQSPSAGRLAQWLAHFLHTEGVTGSIPVTPTRGRDSLRSRVTAFLLEIELTRPGRAIGMGTPRTESLHGLPRFSESGLFGPLESTNDPHKAPGKQACQERLQPAAKTAMSGQLPTAELLIVAID